MEEGVFKKLLFKRGGLTFCGLGEPLLHPHFFDYIELAKSYNMNISFSTNGTLINSDVANRLIELGVDEITFSIDGTYEVHEEMRQGSSFELIADNLKTLFELKGGKMKKPLLQITFVGLTTNIREFPKVVEFFAPFVSTVRFNHVQPYSQSIANSHVFKSQRNDVERVFRKAREIGNKKGVEVRTRPLYPKPSLTCIEPWISPYIATDGTVYPCCILGDHHGLKFIEFFEDAPITYDLKHYAMGNLKKQNLNEIWSNRKFKAFRAKLRSLWWQSLKKWTIDEYVELRKKSPAFFCEICSYRWGCVC